ncbi:MAG TPA: ATP-binding protein [Acidimicrobiia bacterium]
MVNRGRLRVFMGAAPGVGKTFAMLEEAHRLRDLGHDVVIGFVETHGRVDTAALIEGLEVVPRMELSHRGGQFEEMDLDAVIARRPTVALVDELAHTNVPGSRHAKRWEDVEEILNSGIEVITTLNVQHLESLNDVIFEITGVQQRETIPDSVVRRADEIELVDLTQEGIRARMAAGKIYPAERVDAALANYFRPGNLSALRELALSWTADRVDEALAQYRHAQGIEEPWETRERVVVGLTGALGGDAVVRRAARIAMRSRAELLGVYVRPTDGLSVAEDEYLAEQRELLGQFGGSYHEIVGDDVGDSLLVFARSENATQIILGASRRSRLDEFLRGSPIHKVIRRSGSIDVHVISYEGAPGAGYQPQKRAGRSALGVRRRVAAWSLLLAGLPLLTWLLVLSGEMLGMQTNLLLYLLLAVGVGLIGGVLPAVVAAVAGFFLANWYLTPPVGTLTIRSADDLVALIVFLLVAVSVGVLVGISTRQSADARRARAQAEALAATTSQPHPVLESGPAGSIDRIRDTFALRAVAVLRRGSEGWESLAQSGTPDLTNPDQGTEVIELTSDTVMVLLDGKLSGDDRRVLRAFAVQIANALEREQLELEAGSAEAMAETDRLRTALLGAVSHDLRTPLASIKASVTSLLETGVDWSPDQTEAFLVAILGETERLNRLVGRLLDASRVQMGALHVFFRPTVLAEVTASALAGLGPIQSRVEVDVPESLPEVQTDPELLERVIANLVDNALNWSPPDRAVRVTAGPVAGRIDLRVIDRGPGIPVADREKIFQPFQRLGDAPRGAGVGLGLAVSRGFLDAMGNELLVEDTPGGGTTMVIAFKVVPTTRVATTIGTGEASG